MLPRQLHKNRFQFTNNCVLYAPRTRWSNGNINIQFFYYVNCRSGKHSNAYVDRRLCLPYKNSYGQQIDDSRLAATATALQTFSNNNRNESIFSVSVSFLTSAANEAMHRNRPFECDSVSTVSRLIWQFDMYVDVMNREMALSYLLSVCLDQYISYRVCVYACYCVICGSAPKDDAHHNRICMPLYVHCNANICSICQTCA